MLCHPRRTSGWKTCRLEDISCLPQPNDASRSTQATTTALQESPPFLVQENHTLRSLHCSLARMIDRHSTQAFTKCVEGQ
ncbi:unnamed protein product [Musa acuminata subsp. malaccensis]|uniref:(wild Malaysian banana) hypothetical protein n=1 Tax=Musa acuminata subsp. malaccensis TaxID=214687 RepID=A0A804IPP1_MUSAM|nr:unnamed protein product [Musa acuminata subsp. malaccensis]